MAEFLLDADVAPQLAPLLRAKGHFARTTNGASRYDASDDQQLLLATDLACIPITHDKKDYFVLSHLWHSLSVRWGTLPEPHAGVLVLPQPNSFAYPPSVWEIETLLASRQELAGRVLLLDSKWGWREER